MPVYILLLIAVAPVFAMVATAGDALGRNARVAAVIALTIILSTLAAWLVMETVRTALAIWRRTMPDHRRSEADLYRSADRPRDVSKSNG